MECVEINKLGRQKIDELRNCSYKYPENWIKPRFLKKTITKWNEALVDCPFWYSNEKSYGRRLVWIEEDGTSNAFEYKNKQLIRLLKLKQRLVFQLLQQIMMLQLQIVGLTMI